MPLDCSEKCGRRAAMKRPKTGDTLCQECFFKVFEEEIHATIVENNLFRRGDYVAVAASGGKDSTVLAYIMKLLNNRHDYGLRLVLLSVDEGITGYRDDSLETVKRNEKQYEIPLQIYSYKDLYGWTMDEIVREVGRKNNCTFCGVFRRQALDRGALLLGVNKIVTGHNADDVAETILMNLLRGDVARLQRCTNITTGAEGTLPRCKPFKYTYEKEIVMYAYYKKLDYFSTECIYSPNAYRGHVRALIKDLERIKPSSIVDIIHSGEALSIREGIKMPTQGVCKRCKYISSQDLCKACVMLDGLNKGLPKLGIGKSSKVKGHLERLNNEESISTCDKKDGPAKSGCCGGRGSSGSCSQNEDSIEINPAEGNEVCLSESRKGRRSTNKLKKAQERKNNLKTKTDQSKNSTDLLSQKDESFDATDDDLHLEFFGCGGSAEPFDEGNDEVGTLGSNMSSSSVPVDNVDIENLAELASAMLGRKNIKS